MLVERLEPRPAEADLLEDGLELVGEGVVELLGDALDRRVKAEAGLDRDRKQVHHVGESELDLLAARADLAVDVVGREKEAEYEAHQGREHQAHHAVEEQPDQQPDNEQGDAEAVAERLEVGR